MGNNIQIGFQEGLNGVLKVASGIFNKIVKAYNNTVGRITGKIDEVDRKVGVADKIKKKTNEKLEKAKDNLEALKVDLEKRKDEVVKINEALDKELHKDLLGSGKNKKKKTSGGGSSFFGDNGDNNEPPKPTGGSKKSKLDKIKERLIKERDLEIEAVKNSLLTEEEKNKKLVEIKDKYDKKNIELEEKTNDVLLKKADDYVKDIEKKRLKSSEEQQKVTEKAIEGAKKYRENLDKISKSFDEIKKKAEGALRTVRNEMQEMDKNHAKSLEARYLSVADRIKALKKEHSGLDGLIDRYDMSELEDKKEREYGSLGGIDINTLIEYKKLKSEVLLLEENTTKEQREQAKQLQAQSETEKLISEYKKQRAIKEEQEKIMEAFSKSKLTDKKMLKIGDDGQSQYRDEMKQEFVNIVDFKNAEYARDLLNQQEKLEAEYKTNYEHLEKLEGIIKTSSLAVLNIRKNDTAMYKKELDLRKKAVEEHVRAVNAAYARIRTGGGGGSSRRAYGGSLTKGRVTLVGENGPEQVIARAGSYVQPMNSVSNNSTVNNKSYNLNMGDANIGQFNTVDDFLEALRGKMTNHF